MKKISLITAILLLTFSCCKNKIETIKNPATANTAYDPSPSISKSSVTILVSEEFVQGSEDIPLLQGMEKTFDEGLGFDSTNGSIMSSVYEAKISSEDIKNFYVKTLPQMGWKIKKKEGSKISFKREKESLEIEFFNQNEKNLIRFFISSAF